MPVDLIIEFWKCHQRVKTEIHPSISACVRMAEQRRKLKGYPWQGPLSRDRALVRKERDSDLRVRQHLGPSYSSGRFGQAEETPTLREAFPRETLYQFPHRHHT